LLEVPHNRDQDDLMDLLVSMVTYNSASCLDGSLRSLARQEGVRWELLVVDNASQDGTPAKLERLPNVTLNRTNVGYAAAHNQNLSRFHGRHVLFLNPDLTFSPDLFAGLVSFLDENPLVGVVGPRVLEGPERIPFPPRRFYPGEGMLALEPGLRRKEYAWLSGCCLAIRRAVLEQVRGFDPDYFLYQEETDLCLRVRRAGYRVACCPELEVEHVGQQSQTELSEYERARKVFEGTALFWRKHYPSQQVPSMVRFQYLGASALLAVSRVLPKSVWLRARPFRPERMRARRDIGREWLDRHSFPILLLDRAFWRITLRQLEVLAECLRSGRFPLDDY
jgi:N-acetylglucosaminyl-diphospho-decaprenol L-rhamnosyltransferase